MKLSRIHSGLLSAAFSVVLIPALANAAVYYRLAAGTELGAGTGATGFASAGVVNNTAYSAAVGSTGFQSYINATTPLSSSSRTTSTFISPTATAAFGATNSGINNPMVAIGSNLVGFDNNTKQVYRLNTSNTTLTAIVPNSSFTATTSFYKTPTVTQFGVDSNETVYFYDSSASNRSIGRSTNLSAPLISNSTLVSTLGPGTGTNPSVNGLTVIPGAGKLLIGSNDATRGGIYSYDIASGSFSSSPVVARSAFGTLSNTAFFYAPDKKLYYFDTATASRGIYSVDFTTSTPTITSVYSGADLLAGPQNLANGVSGFSWYGGQIAWYFTSGTTSAGLFGAVPEPSALGLLAPFAAVAFRRNRRA